MKPAPKTRFRGFTLIELLVVISIIALLIAITLPALSKAKLKSTQVVCGTRLHAMGVAMAAYLSEYNNSFPINGILFPKGSPANPTIPDMYASDPRFNTAYAPSMQYWRLEYGALWPMMGGIPPLPSVIPPMAPPTPSIAKAFLCPSDPLSRTYTGTGNAVLPLTLQVSGGLATVNQGTGSPGYWSYSVNSVLNSLGRFRNNFTGGLPWVDPMKGSTIENPTNFIYFVEEADDSLMNDEVIDAPAFGGGDHITNRHNNGGNLAFADGHVDWVSEVAFDHGGAVASGSVTPNEAMQVPWTRYFFPDFGAFAASGP